MISRFRPSLGREEIRAALTIPRSDDVNRFETAFSQKMGQKYAVAFPYGRTGLILLLEALGLEGKEIICPAYTCVVVPHAIVFSGNKPVFVDSQDSDFNMNLDTVVSAITKNTGAIIATSIFGYPVDLDKLEEIKKNYPHIHIIQDCAHSFAAEWKGRPVQKEGIAAIFGLNISKMITSIFGGMVTTDNKDLAEKLFQLRSKKLSRPKLTKGVKRFFYLMAVYPAFWPPIYGLVNKLENSGLLARFVKYYDDSIIDMPEDYREQMTGLEARVGLEQLKKYDAIIEKRKDLAAWYNNQLANIDVLQLPPIVTGATYSHYVPRVIDRNTTINQAQKEGIQLGRLIDYCIPEMPSYTDKQVIKSKFTIASKMMQETINLPIDIKADKAASKKVSSLWKM